jgi:deoxyhypusine synthase
VCAINKIAMKAKKSGVIILGGGVVKHHILNANIWRNGADFAVYINTGVVYDGSDSGATASEGISWGKLKIDANYVKIWAEASLVFPILVAETFAKNHDLAKRN